MKTRTGDLEIKAADTEREMMMRNDIHAWEDRCEVLRERNEWLADQNHQLNQINARLGATLERYHQLQPPAPIIIESQHPATIDETIDHLRALIRALPTENVPTSIRFARASLDEILVQLRGLLQ